MVNVIKCAKINPSEKVLSLIIVTKANAKGCVHGSWKKFYRSSHQRIFPKFFQKGPKVVKFVFSHLKLRKQPFLLKFFKPRGTKVPLLPFRRPWLCLNTQCSNNNNLACALFLVFDDNKIFVCCSANRECQSLTK